MPRSQLTLPSLIPQTGTAAAFLPEDRSLEALEAASKACQGCELYARASQTVFGAGATGADLMLVGEQPGDQEDVQGKPFVGPAGRLLDRALVAAGIDRRQTYVTNAVKHFKWVARGKRRIHQSPNAREITACRPWLEAEIAAIRPKVIVALGASAAQSLIGPDFRVTRQRGELLRSPLAPHLMATVHPSSILRAQDDQARELELELFIRDLSRVAPLLAA